MGIRLIFVNQAQNPHSNVAKGATLEWGTRFHLTRFHLTRFHLTRFHLTRFHLTRFHLTRFHLTRFHLTPLYLTRFHLTRFLCHPLSPHPLSSHPLFITAFYLPLSHLLLFISRCSHPSYFLVALPSMKVIQVVPSTEVSTFRL